MTNSKQHGSKEHEEQVVSSQVDANLLTQLASMGFADKISRKALMSGCSNLESAIVWITDRDEDNVNAEHGPALVDTDSAAANVLPLKPAQLATEVAGNTDASAAVQVAASPPLELEPGSRAERMHLALVGMLAQNDASGSGEALDTMAAILHNIALNPGVEKFKRLKLANGRFRKAVSSRAGALDFLEGVGFERIDEHLELKRSDPGLLWLGQSLLQHHRGSLGC